MLCAYGVVVGSWDAGLDTGPSLWCTNWHVQVDRSLIGGLTVDIGERHVDLSIRSRIKQLEKILADNV